MDDECDRGSQRSHNGLPTSPWTEAYQRTASPISRFDDSDDHTTQDPTHDALSDIYNRGYW
jgi:hypothetical protein